jgi:hypothetical protein
MQQIRERMLVVHVRCCHHGAVCQPRLAVHPDMNIHPEVVSRPRGERWRREFGQLGKWKKLGSESAIMAGK